MGDASRFPKRLRPSISGILGFFPTSQGAFDGGRGKLTVWWFCVCFCLILYFFGIIVYVLYGFVVLNLDYGGFQLETEKTFARPARPLKAPMVYKGLIHSETLSPFGL